MNKRRKKEGNLSLRYIFISLGESLDVVLEVTVIAEELHIGTIDLDATLLAEASVLLTAQRGEAPVLGDNDLLATREFVHGSSESLDGGGTVRISSTNRKENLANIHTSNGAIGLAKGTTHTGLETIGSGARQHLVNPDDVEWMRSDTQVETFFAGDLDEVLVSADTSSFKGL